MRSHNQRLRLCLRFALEALEGRVALSGMHGIHDGQHHHRGPHAAEVRHMADDRVNHNTGGGNLARHSGLDERAGHNAADDNLPRHGGKDDGNGHR